MKRYLQTIYLTLQFILLLLQIPHLSGFQVLVYFGVLYLQCWVVVHALMFSCSVYSFYIIIHIFNLLLSLYVQQYFLYISDSFFTAVDIFFMFQLSSFSVNQCFNSALMLFFSHCCFTSLLFALQVCFYFSLKPFKFFFFLYPHSSQFSTSAS